MNENILIIEDDDGISEMVQVCMEKEGYTVTIARDGIQGMELFKKKDYQLILLDLMLPKRNGIEVLKDIRSSSQVPVLIMSAKETDVDKALGLGFGADDYIGKPFSLIELVARVKATMRRAHVYSGMEVKELFEDRIQVGNMTILKDTFSIEKGEKIIRLTLKEYYILELLATHPKRVFTKAQIYKAVWDEEYYGDENVINVHIRRLREKVEDNPSTPTYITTVWGIGYRLGESVG